MTITDGVLFHLRRSYFPCHQGYHEAFRPATPRCDHDVR